MTKDEATSFESGHSLQHAAILAMAANANGCECEPYVDWFTYKRWTAQGMQVQRGEHGVKLSVFVKAKKTDKDGKETEYTRPWGTTVFCRCQVAEKGADNGKAA